MSASTSRVPMTPSSPAGSGKLVFRLASVAAPDFKVGDQSVSAALTASKKRPKRAARRAAAKSRSAPKRNSAAATYVTKSNVIVSAATDEKRAECDICHKVVKTSTSMNGAFWPRLIAMFQCMYVSQPITGSIA